MTPSFREIVGEAVAGLSRNRTRAVLSTVGIAWGIVSVVMLLSYGNGFRDALGVVSAFAVEFLRAAVFHDAVGYAQDAYFGLVAVLGHELEDG